MSYDYGLNAAPKKEPKSYVVALALGLILGCFGVHRFYVGKWKTGLAMLICTLTGCLSIVSVVWYFIDMFALCTNKFTDVDGDELDPYNSGCAIIAGILVLLSLILSIIVCIFYFTMLLRAGA